LKWHLVRRPEWVAYGSSVLVDGRRRAALVVRLCAARCSRSKYPPGLSPVGAHSNPIARD
jgi:hypothetical protein